MDRGHLRFQSRTSHWAKLTARFIWVMEPFSCYRVQIYIYISQISYPAFAIQIQYHCVCFVHCTAVPRMPSEETGPLDMRCEALHELSPPTCIAWLWQQVWYVWVRAPRSLSPAIFLPRPHTYTHTHLQTHLNTYISSTSTTSTRTCWTSRSSRTSRS